MGKELVDLTMKLHAETAAAIRVSDDGDDKHAVWLPKSQVEFETVKPGYVEVTLPEWLAIDKGLV
jgi:hypothetical protein